MNATPDIPAPSMPMGDVVPVPATPDVVIAPAAPVTAQGNGNTVLFALCIVGVLAIGFWIGSRSAKAKQ